MAIDFVFAIELSSYACKSMCTDESILFNVVLVVCVCSDCIQVCV